MKNFIVIGGGAAGLMAAGKLAQCGDTVSLIEKNNILGRKLLITGKGRCNVTTSVDISDFFGYIPVNSSFLYSSIYTFTNENTIEFFENSGVPLKEERGNRIFPVSDKSKDIVEALKRHVLVDNVKLYHETVKKIIIKDGAAKGVVLSSGREILGDGVLIATGGASYPLTGSTGDGYKFAKQAGHSVITPKASLVPLNVDEGWINQLMGLSLKNVSVTIFDNENKKVFEDFGEMIFTHFGVSGPIILSASAHIRDVGDNGKKYKLEIDLKPALDAEKLDKRILRDFEENNNKQFINVIGKLVPIKLIEHIVSFSGIDPRKAVNQITKSEREKLIDALKHFTLTITSKRPIDEAIITSGGVNVKEINPSTMESKIVENLYFAGEVIDVDGYTGGFNLQIAFSTGYLAATSMFEKGK